MSVLDRRLVLDEDVLELGDDRVGLLAFRVLIAILGGGCTSSDGTLPWSNRTLRHSLLVGVAVTDQEVAEVRARLERRLMVAYDGPDGRQYAFLRRWWLHNRPDRAVRGSHNPEVPAEVLAGCPEFASIYCSLRARAAGRPSVPQERQEAPGKSGQVQGQGQEQEIPLIPQEGDDSALPGFQRFWGALPTWLQQRRVQAVRVWQALHLETDLRKQEQIRAALRWQGRSAEWRERNFRTLTSVSYLRNRRWTDSPPVAAPVAVVKLVESAESAKDRERRFRAEWERDPENAGRPWPGSMRQAMREVRR